jgi:hypothetical protein
MAVQIISVTVASAGVLAGALNTILVSCAFSIEAIKSNISVILNFITMELNGYLIFLLKINLPLYLGKNKFRYPFP